MVIIFIVILVVVGIIAVWFNVWNHRNPVGKSKQNNQAYSIENLQSINRKYNEQVFNRSRSAV